MSKGAQTQVSVLDPEFLWGHAFLEWWPHSRQPKFHWGGPVWKAWLHDSALVVNMAPEPGSVSHKSVAEKKNVTPASTSNVPIALLPSVSLTLSLSIFMFFFHLLPRASAQLYQRDAQC